MNNLHPQIPIFEYNYITDGIYIGTNQCCQIDFDKALKKEGLTVDISLEENRVDAPFGVDFYVWIPVIDHMAPKRDQLEFGVSILEKLVAMGKKVYVHCKNGHGRAPMLVAAYLIRKGKSAEVGSTSSTGSRQINSPQEAEAFIKSKRPSMHLDDIQRQALVNFQKTLVN